MVGLAPCLKPKYQLDAFDTRRELAGMSIAIQNSHNPRAAASPERTAPSRVAG